AVLLDQIENFLLRQHRIGRRVLIVIDEAQNLPLPTIEELRMLSNLCLNGRPLVQSFLLGQPQFRSVLNEPELEQVRQRVIASYRLEPMTADETRGYIEHRLRLVGWRDHPQISDSAFLQIHAATNGIPRRINSLCNRLF